MRGVKWLSLVMAALFLLPSLDADARRRRRRKAKVVKQAGATKEQKAEYGKLLGKFKWGMRAEKVLKDLEGGLRTDYKTLMRKEPDAIKQDAIRREMLDKIKQLKANYVKFTGKRSQWDVSMIEGEYAHKNDEAMIVRWGQRDRRFYFFHFGKLWKIYIAFNSELFRGKKFMDFVKVMERRFGRAEAKFKPNRVGASVLSHMEWPAAGNTVLKAIDETAFYANFCLVMLDKEAKTRILEGRRINSPKKRKSDALVDAVTRKNGSAGGGNDNIVDQITGKAARRPGVGDQSGSSGSSGSVKPTRRDDPPVRTRKKTKINPKDPLGGLDI